MTIKPAGLHPDSGLKCLLLDFVNDFGLCGLNFFYTCGGLRTFLLAQKSNQKRASAIDNPPIAGWFPDLAFALLWLQHLFPDDGLKFFWL